MRTAKCPNCGEDMVAGKFVTQPGGLAAQSVAYARPSGATWWDTFLGRNRTLVPHQEMMVCWRCGLMTLFVEDPSIFRPKNGTETLPRPAREPAPSTETLPRRAAEPQPDSKTLPRPASEEGDQGGPGSENNGTAPPR